MSYDVWIDYTNWKGERAMRHVRPCEIRFASQRPYHPEVQWLLHAFDVDKKAKRDFAMRNIHAWYFASPSSFDKAFAEVGYVECKLATNGDKEGKLPTLLDPDEIPAERSQAFLDWWHEKGLHNPNTSANPLIAEVGFEAGLRSKAPPTPREEAPASESNAAALSDEAIEACWNAAEAEADAPEEEWLLYGQKVAAAQRAALAASQPAKGEAAPTAREVAWRWRFKEGKDRTWRYAERYPRGDNFVVEMEPLFLASSTPTAREGELQKAAEFVIAEFKKSEAAGYHTRDREFAIEILSKALASFAPTAREGDALDAARYRWLRDNRAYVGVAPHPRELPKAERTGWTMRFIHGDQSSLDAAIDTALASSALTPKEQTK